MVTGCKLRVASKIPSTAHCRADFYQKRNAQPWLCIRFFFSICATLWWVLFIIFYYIIYNIYSIQRYKAKNINQ